MSIGSADVQKSVVTVWNNSTLNTTFQNLRASGTVDSEFPVLNDQEALAGHVFPYCVFQFFDSFTTDRMSSVNANKIREIRDVPVEFRVFARAVSGDSRTAKEIAAFLVEEIMSVFGGHPEDSPTTPSLDFGNFLIAQYQNDSGLRLGDDEYQWTVSYLCRADVPVGV